MIAGGNMASNSSKVTEVSSNIVQKRNAGGDLIGHLLCEVIGVKNIRDTGFVQLSVVCCIGKAHGSMR